LKKLKFRGANGGEIKHYGERAVFVTSEGFLGREVRKIKIP